MISLTCNLLLKNCSFSAKQHDSFTHSPQIYYTVRLDVLIVTRSRGMGECCLTPNKQFFSYTLALFGSMVGNGCN